MCCVVASTFTLSEAFRQPVSLPVAPSKSARTRRRKVRTAERASDAHACRGAWAPLPDRAHRRCESDRQSTRKDLLTGAASYAVRRCFSSAPVRGSAIETDRASRQQPEEAVVETT